MSEKAKFTQGPWVDDGDGWIGAESGESVVEYAGCGSHEAWWKNPADKALVLSAPELYEALEYALADYDDWVSHEDNYPNEHLVAWSDKARAALAKARGES